jgi:hypothetical protein
MLFSVVIVVATDVGFVIVVVVVAAAVVVCGVVLTYEDYRLFGCDSVQTGRCVSMIQKNQLRDDRGFVFCEPSLPIYHITRHHISAVLPYEPQIQRTIRSYLRVRMMVRLGTT